MSASNVVHKFINVRCTYLLKVLNSESKPHIEVRIDLIDQGLDSESDKKTLL